MAVTWRRRVPVSILLLVLAAVASQVLLWWLAPAPKPRSMSGPPRSGYTLTNFHLQVLTATGAPGVNLTAPQLQRRNGDGSLFVTQPVFDLTGTTDSHWLGNAEHGWVSADGSQLKLLGRVHMHRPATASATQASIDSADVSAWPNQHRLQTAATTVIHEPGRILRGVGMKVDLTTHTMELLAHVHGTFQPATHH